jgi:hypothetical protein
MRTKTLLLTAALSAAGIASSMAQVYSVNIVGYANSAWAGNKFTLVANPFDDGSGNQLTNIGAQLPVQSQILFWSGATFTTATKGGSPATFNINTSLPPGVGFFVRNGKVGGTVVPDITNTFVGSVAVAPGGSVSTPLPVGFTLLGSPIPYAGDVTVSGTGGGDTNINVGVNLPGGGSQVLIWNKAAQTYSTATKGGSPGTWNLTTPISVAEGFFARNKTGPATNFVQTLP